MTSQYFGGRITGGATGGFHALKKYHTGVLTTEKERLIRNLASDLKNVLKFQGDVENDPIDKVVSLLSQKIPDPRRHALPQDATVHAHVCNALAHALNKRYGQAVIDTRLDTSEVCNKVAELMNTLVSGLQSEFVSTASDVKRTIKNLEILKNSLRDSFTRLYNAAQSSNDESLKVEAYGMDQIYQSLLIEIDRQLAALSNIIGVTIDPVTDTIAQLTSEDRDFTHYVRSLGSSLGSPDLSRKLTYMLAGVQNVANITRTIDNALKKVGYSIDDYQNTSSNRDLLDKLYSSFEKSKHSSDELAKFIAAAELIKTYDYAHDDIQKHLKEKASSKKKSKKGGDSFNGTNSLKKRMDTLEKTRNTLFNDFENRLDQQYRTIQSAISVLAKRIGNDLPIDDNLQNFVTCMSDMNVSNTINREEFSKALTGFHTDAASKEERQRFLGQLDAVIRSLKPLVSGPHGSYFNTIKAAAEKTREIVDTFKDTYLKPLTNVAFKTGGYDKNTNERDFIDALDNNMEYQNYINEPAKSDDGNEDSDSPDRSDNLVDEDEEVKDSAGPVGSDDGNKDSDNLVKEDDGHEDSAKPDDEDEEAEKEKRSEEILAAKEAEKEKMKEAVDVSEQKEKLLKKIDQLKSILAANKQDDSMKKTMTERMGQLESRLKALNNPSTGGDSTYVTLGQAIRHLEFYYNAAKVRHNLSIASKDISSYSKDYETILGDAVGDLVIQQKKEYDTERKSIEDASNPMCKVIEDWIKDGKDQKEKDERKSTKESALKYLKETMNVKVDLLKTVEAIDLYMGNFADAVASNPDSIKDMETLLKNVDIVAKWFNEKSGDSIAELFDMMPAGYSGSDPTFVVPDFTESESHYYAWVGSLLGKSSLPGNPLNGVMPGGKDDEESMYDQLLEASKKATLGVRVLDNLISMFAKIGSQFGNTTLVSKTFMPIGVIFKNLRKYMFHSTFVMGRKDNTLCSSTKILSSVNIVHQKNHTINVGVSADKNPIETSPSDIKTAKQRDDFARHKFGLSFSTICQNDKLISGFKDTWCLTDKLFIMSIKAIVAKVFTVIGTYGVFNKPLDKYKSLSNTRLILGGFAEKTTIIPEATELYIRLPLLAEFYRELFDYKDPSSSRKIYMLPEFNGVWDKFLTIVFDEAKYVKEGSYSEHQVRALINEINEIYRRYREADSTKVVNNVISALVAEINRRFGVVKQTEITAYLKDRAKYSDRNYTSMDDQLDYNILDERDQHGRRPAPSDRYDSLYKDETKITNVYDKEYEQLVRDFRDKMDADIKNLLLKNEKPPKVSFSSTIRQYRKQIEASKDDDRYNVILKAMQGVDQLSSINVQKAAMFHEAVLAPLNTLHHIYKTFYTFIVNVASMNVAEIDSCISKFVNDNWGKTIETGDFVNALKEKKFKYENYLNYGYDPHTGCDATANRIGYYSPAHQLNKDNILVRKGTYGAHENVIWKNILDFVQSASKDNQENVAEGITRFTVNRNKIMYDMINICFALGADLGDLTSVKVQQNNFMIEYGKIAETCTDLLNSVKKNLELFRGVIDNKTIELVEGGSSGRKQPEAGTIYFLEENLIERIFKSSHNDVKNKIFPVMGMANINEILASNFKSFLKKWNVLGRVDMSSSRWSVPIEKSNNKANNLLAKHENDLLMDSYEEAMAKLAYWSPVYFYCKGADINQLPHILKGDEIINDNADKWPFAVIPNITNGTSSNDNLSQLKNIMLAMDNILKTFIDYDGLTDATGKNKKLISVPIGLAGEANSYTQPELFGISVNVKAFSHSMKMKNTYGPSKVPNYTDLIKRYNTLVDQKERIMASSIRTPLAKRLNTYNDPSEENGAKLANEKGDMPDYGLLVTFNDVLSKYLYNGWDTTTRKMYSGLIAKFASGTHFNACNKGHAINDIETNNFQIGVPAQHTVLFASLARAMRNIMTVVKSPSEAEFKVDNLMDVPIHMKETMRANLPNFDKLFKLIIKKAELLRQVSQQVSLIRQLSYTSKYGMDSSLTASAAELDKNDIIEPKSGFSCRNVPSDVLADAKSVNWLLGTGNSRRQIWEDIHKNSLYDNYSYVAFDAVGDLGLESSRKWHIELLDDISNAAMSISKCAMETYTELADEPKFLETHENFITDYINLNKYHPVMALSQLQVALKQRFDRTQTPYTSLEFNTQTKSGFAYSNFMLPFYRSGEQAFKLTYGSRLVLGRPSIKPTLEYMPWMNNLLEQYNGVSTNDTRIEKADYEKFTVNHTSLLRYMVDVRFYKFALSGENMYIDKPGLALFNVPDYTQSSQQTATATGSTVFDLQISDQPKELYSLGYEHELDIVLGFTESNSQEDVNQKFKNKVALVKAPIDSRASARIYNIIDMNIVPINVHALMREIPLINIINYSYTCDRMVQDTLLKGVEQPTDNKLIKETQTVTSSAGLLTKMILYPYAHLNTYEFHGYLARLMTGDSSIELGRPKFLSDQLWNKSLFQELYTQPIPLIKGSRVPNESGPSGDNAQNRLLNQLMYDVTLISSSSSSSPGPFSTDPKTAIGQIATQFKLQTRPDLSDDQSLQSEVKYVNDLYRFVDNNQTDTQKINSALKQNSNIPNTHMNAIIAQLYDMYSAGTIDINHVKTVLTALLTAVVADANRSSDENHLLRNNGSLSYPEVKDGRVVVQNVELDQDKRSYLSILGKFRFDTTFVRNLFFLCNIQRVMRMVLRDELAYLESPVVTASHVVNRQITDYANNEVYTPETFE